MSRPNNGTWIDLDEIIYEYISESEQSSHKYFRMWYIAFRGMEQLGIDFFYQIQSVKLPVSAAKTATLPSNYGNYSKVGILNSIGEIIPFTYNKNLSLFADTNSQRVSKVQSDIYSTYYDANSLCFYNYWDGSEFGNLYGVPSGGYNGTFRIDEANQVIIFGSDFSYTDIVLEYTALPKDGEKYFVPRIFRQALISWIAWNDIANMPIRRGVAQNIAQREARFYNERRLARARYRPFHLEEAHQWNIQSQRLTIKM